MRGLLAAALILGAVSTAAADSGLVDFSKPRRFKAVSHPSAPKAWTSYELHSEDGLGVFLIHLDADVQRNVYRLKTDAVAISLHDAHLKRPKPAKTYQKAARGDVYDQREGSVGGGWYAGGTAQRGGVDMLFIVAGPALPDDLDQDAGREARGEKGEHPESYVFEDARSQVDSMSGAVRRARVVDNPSLKVDVLRLTARAAIKNTASSSAMLLAVEGAVAANTSGAPSTLSGNRLFLTDPGEVVHLKPAPGKPAYLLLITPAN